MQTDENAQYRQQLAALRQQLTAASAALTAAREQQRHWEDKLQAQLAAAHTDYAALEAKHADALARIAELEASVFRLTGQLEQADAK